MNYLGYLYLVHDVKMLYDFLPNLNGLSFAGAEPYLNMYVFQDQNHIHLSQQWD